MTSLLDTPAILGGTPIRHTDYPSWPIWDETERAGLLDVLEHGGWWQGDGDVAATFGREFAAYHGATYGMALTNGTHTLVVTPHTRDGAKGDAGQARTVDFTVTGASERPSRQMKWNMRAIAARSLPSAMASRSARSGLNGCAGGNSSAMP